MALLDGISSLGSGLSALAGQQANDLAEQQTKKPLLNDVPSAPETPAKLTPTYADLNASITSGTNHGNALDAATLDRAHQVYLGLTARGMDPNTAVGFAANAVQESRANPATGAGDMGASHGLMQWRDDRYANYVAKYGNSMKLDDQLDHILSEVSGPEAKAWQAIQSAPNDPAAKAAAVSQFYERPKDTAAEIERRSYIANQLAGHFAQRNNGGA